MFSRFQPPPSLAEPSSSGGMRAGTLRPVFQRNEGSRKRLMSDDQPSSAAVNPVKRVATNTATYSTSAPGETHTATTDTDSQWLPKQDHPKGDPQCRSRGNLRLPIFCTSRPQLRHCSQNEVVEVEFAVCQTEATQLGESPGTALRAWFEKDEERFVSARRQEKRSEMVRAKQSEISSFMEHASGVHSAALMRMRCVITRKP